MDLRQILVDFEIADGGGHPGAIGFRVPKDSITDLPGYISRVLEKIETL
jgi:nanoRNase/pAp phosphatase (c-di-AMP/oligoRNAs hydrolase)